MIDIRNKEDSQMTLLANVFFAAYNARIARSLIVRYVAFLDVDVSSRPGCNQEAFVHWQCCKHHRKVQRIVWSLNGQAQHVMDAYGFTSRGNYFSVTWWKDFSNATGIVLPTKILKSLQTEREQ